MVRIGDRYMSVYVVWFDGKELCLTCDNAEITDSMIIIYYSDRPTRNQYIPLNSVRYFSTSETLKFKRS